jgi:hypothetical protein
LGERLVFVPHVTTYKGAVHATIPTLPAPDIATTGVISYLEVWPISLFAPKGGEQALVALSPHDSGLQALAAFEAAFPGAYRTLKVGEAIQFP